MLNLQGRQAHPFVFNCAKSLTKITNAPARETKDKAHIIFEKTPRIRENFSPDAAHRKSFPLFI